MKLDHGQNFAFYDIGLHLKCSFCAILYFQFNLVQSIHAVLFQYYNFILYKMCPFTDSMLLFNFS